MNLEPDIGTAERRGHLGPRSDGRRRRPHALLLDGDDGSPVEPSERRLDRRSRRSPHLGTLKRHHRQRRSHVWPPERLKRRSHVRRRPGKRPSVNVLTSNFFPREFSLLVFERQFRNLTDELLADRRRFPPPEHVGARYGSLVCFVQPPLEAVQG